MSFILQSPLGNGGYQCSDLGFDLDDGEERDLYPDFSGEELFQSADLQTGISSGLVYRLDAIGGSAMPALAAFDDQGSGHEGNPHAHGLSVSVLAGISDAGSGKIATTVERAKLATIASGAQVNDDGTDILAKLAALAAPIALDVEKISGKTSAQILDRTQHTGLQPSSSISDFSAAADARITAQKGINGGLASLDGSGKIPASQLTVSAFTFKGVWNAAANIPALVSSVGGAGDTYRVVAAGATTLNGNTDWEVGDEVVFGGFGWIKRDNTESVFEVNGQSGNVDLDTDDVNEGARKYFSDSLVSASPNVAANTAKVSADGLLSTHSDVSMAIPTEGQVLTRVSGTWKPKTILPINIYGTERQFWESQNVETTKASWLEKLYGDLDVVKGQKYKIELSYFWNLNSTSNDFNARLTFDGLVVVDHFQEPKDSAGSFGSTGTNQKPCFTRPVFLTAAYTGAYYFELTFRATANTYASMWGATIEKIRVG